MKEDSESEIRTGCIQTLEKLGVADELNFDYLNNLLVVAGTHLKSRDDSSCVLAIREVSSILSTKRLTFVEFKAFLPPLFQFMNEVVWKFRNSVTVDDKKMQTSDPIFLAASKLCQNLIICADMDEIVYEFTSMISDLQNSSNSIENPTGILITFNIVLTILIRDKRDSISEFEAANLAEIYVSLIDMQSTEVILTQLSSDIPAVQSAAEIRKAYLLEGLGILGKGYPKTVIPVVLYPLIEHAGLQNSEAVNEAAHLALKKISHPLEIPQFLEQNLEFIMNEISVRMLNLILYPNCPSALIYLAQYFDFSKENFTEFIDQIFERSSDTLGGGNVQHIYVRVFYALVKSISNHFQCTEEGQSGSTIINKDNEPSLLEKMLEYQKSVGILHPSVLKDMEKEATENLQESDFKTEGEIEGIQNEETQNQEETVEALDPVRELVLRISHRVLNFLPNNERSVRLSAMDSLICGLPLLKRHENSILPLSHTIWQNLVPRLAC